MAERTGGTVAVRFSVKDAETVRVALDRLGKDGRHALDAIDRAASNPSRGVTALNEAVAHGRSQLQAWAAQFGTAGAILTRLGPTGLVAAGAIGAVAITLYKGSQAAHEFARDMLGLRDTATALGLTTEQLQAVADAGSDFALTGERVNAGLERLASQLDEARRATGTLYDAVRQISPAFALELAGTKNTAEAIDVLGKAYLATEDAAKKAAVSRAAFGRTGGFELGHLTQLIAEKGGVDALTAAFKQTGDAIDPGLVNRTSKLKAEIDDMAGDARRNVLSIFSEQVLNLQHRYTERVRDMTRLFKDGDFRAALRELLNISGSVLSFGLWQPSPRGTQSTSKSDLETASFGDRFGSWPGRQAQDRLSAEAQLNQERERIKVLGEAATAADRLRLRQLELAVATDNWTRYQGEGNRALAAFSEVAARAAVSARVQLGVATVGERAHQIAIDISRAKTEGYIRTKDEEARATALATRELRKQIEQEQIRASLTPELTRFAVESQNTFKAVDQVAAQSLDTASDKLSEFGVNLLSGQAKLRDFRAAFSEMAASIARDLLRIALNKAILGPLSGGLSGILGSLFPSASGNVIDGGRIMAFAGGGILGGPTIFPLANGLGLAGEAGPEAIMPLRRINGRLGVEARGGGNITIAPTINVTAPPGAQRGDGERFGAEIGNTVTGLVRAEILRQKRSGGLLA